MNRDASTRYAGRYRLIFSVDDHFYTAMHKQLPAWQLILHSMQAHVPVMLLYVLESSGSSPGRQGFMMTVNGAGAMSGSLGGGIMEHKFVELAKAKLAAGSTEPLVQQQVHDKEAAKNQSGMICSGEQTIFMYQVQQADLFNVEQITLALQQNRPATLQLSPGGIVYKEAVPTRPYSLQLSGTNDFILVEKLGFKNNLYIIGGGHCALALSQLASGLDFYIRLYDNRPALNTMEQNRYVHEMIVVADYADLEKMIVPASSDFVVIMTFGYRTDHAVVKALAGKPFRYIGMLGSRHKIGKLFEQLRAEGVNQAQLDQVKAPVGLSIRSQTPEEIAVSIAAEIILEKNRNL